MKRPGSGAAPEAERQVADYMARLADGSIPVAPRLPSAEAIWVKAELLRRLDARNAALAPLDTMEHVQIAAGLAAAVVVLVRVFPSLLDVLGRG